MKQIAILIAEMAFRITVCAIVVIFVLPLNAFSWDREGGPAGAGGLGKIPAGPFERPDPYQGHNVRNVRGNEEFKPAIPPSTAVELLDGKDTAPETAPEPFGPDDMSGR